MDKILDGLFEVNKGTVLTQNLIAFKSQCETLAFICKVRMVTLPLPLYVTSAKCLVLATLHGRHGQQLYFHSLHKKKKRMLSWDRVSLKGLII